MSGRTILVGALALICGMTAALGTSQYLMEPVVEQAPEHETISIPVVAVQISRGDEILETMIMERDWPKELVPENAVLEKEALIGKIAQAAMYPTEPFLQAKVGESERFSGMVEAGMRAYTILTPDDASLVAGLITPGDKVDVLFTDRQSQKEFTGGGSTTPLLQNIEVMAVGRELDAKNAQAKEMKDMRSVTLAVTLDMATKLALAQQLGTLHLALRSEQDQSTAPAAAITLNELMRTMYPALNDVPAEESEEDPAAVVAEAPLLEALDATVAPLERREIVVRTLRGFAPSDLVMSVSQDGSRRISDLAKTE